MPMIAIFGAVILAAEAAAAAAAEIAAAEAAAATAAEVAATEAATAAAAEAALQQTAQQATQAGIMEVGGATANNPLTAEAVQNAAINSGQNFTQGLPQGFEQQLQNVQNLSQGPSVQVASADPSAGIKSLDITPKGSLDPSTGRFTNTTLGAPTNVTASVPGDISNAAMRSGIDPSIASGPAPTDAMMRAGMDPAFLNGPTPSDAMMRGFTPAPGMSTTTSLGPFNPPPSSLESGFTKAMDWADKNPFKASAIAYTGANALGLLDPSAATFNQEKYDGPLSKYKLSPNFQPGSANPANFQYKPRYAVGGGIMGAGSYDIPVGYDKGGYVPEYAKGGSLSDSIESYQKMLEGKPQAAPSRPADVGIYYDQDPDTRYQDALTAAQIRQAKVNQRAYVSPPVAKRPTPMGQLQMASVKPRKQSDSGGGDVEAASGGIMHSSLGGYAAGGNPRLLKGPGDGMSDNIPATINGRQPARLADGEFVIPADVVSHLGNGSTEAGAKQLHAMMNKVRRARTGNSKQGKNIKPQKYMPK